MSETKGNMHSRFIPIKEFLDDNGFHYRENKDTRVLEYLYPVAQCYKPDFEIHQEDLDDTLNLNLDEDFGISQRVKLIQYPTQAVKDFVFRYNCVQMDKRGVLHPDYKEKNIASVEHLERRKEKIKEYEKIIVRKSANKKEELSIQEYISLYQLDSEKFWYLFLFISDFVEGLCLNNIQVMDSSFNQTMKFMDAILANTNQEPMKLEIKIGKKHPLKIENNRAIFYIASAIEYLKDKLEHNIPDFTTRKTDWKTSIELSTGETLSYFAKMFIYFFNITESISKTRKKEGEISNKELRFIYLLFKLSNLSQIKTDSPEAYIRKQLERYPDKPQNVANRYYL